MKNTIFALLTTLFAFAMPLQAALAQDDAEGCPTHIVYSQSLRPEIRDRIAAQHGTLREFEGEKASRIVEKLADFTGQNAPPVDQVAVVVPSDEKDAPANIGMFQRGCLIGFVSIPQDLFETFLPPQGEKVD